jgi:formylglycine-generating enzyme required for sulfatase activity
LPEQQELLSKAYRLQDEPMKRLQDQLAASEMALREARWNHVRRWYLNSQGQTMVVISKPWEYATSAIDHAFAVSTHEVTVGEFLRFRPNHRYDSVVAPSKNCPVISVTFQDAAEYCNWLSQQDGIPEEQWAYLPSNDGTALVSKENFQELEGYRLPTAAEWEYACRGGTSGRYCFGEPLSLLRNYSQYMANSSGHTQPVEALLPNDLGLFDMHGNVWEQSQPIEGFLSHGGSFLNPWMQSRSAHRTKNVGTGFFNFGFRPFRTYHLSP